MNITMRLTLDGLLKGLRMTAHAMAEQKEERYPRGAGSGLPEVPRSIKRHPKPTENDDDFSGD
ncbi:hypothetical protein [Aquamicrobium sp. LC103]|uniref:hypothetical protein n=1 Tax=Aquamicrobium sp. LC103 TaxID=1120658 RepID=UPI00063EA764|nr:hypothetical protein [Aquamicrobium sp. LC103]TKT81228.1 hypothetical protein XW59_005000 [Aquamicrobium sp. LC103]